jgi:PHP family Zn ribbon phosphoesterase
MIWEGAPVRAAQRSTENYLAATIEFFPEEGKYHHDGHRVCGVNWTPEERKQQNGNCTSCGKPVTVGVLSRIDDLADRPVGFKPSGAPDFLQIVPIRDIASALFGVGKQSKRITRIYQELVGVIGSEFELLLNAPIDQIAKASNDEFAAIVQQMRDGDITMTPGYDGVYGKLSLSSQEVLRQSIVQREMA